jgi:hypothetical protein
MRKTTLKVFAFGSVGWQKLMEDSIKYSKRHSGKLNAEQKAFLYVQKIHNKRLANLSKFS